MATRAVESIPTAGIAATYYAATVTTGDKVAAGEGVFIHVKNGGGSPITVTLTTPGTVDTLAIADRAVTVTNAGEKFIAVPVLYRDPADGLATFVCSAVTSVTFAAVRI